MVNKCAAINCRSGYSGDSKNPNVTFHSFPLNNEELSKIWLKNIARKDFTPTKYSRLCSLYFKAEDFKESSDQTQSCKNRRKNVKLLNRRLKKGAIPTIFKNLPSYYVSEDVPLRSGMALPTLRNEKAAKLLEEQTEKSLETDELKSFDSLVSCLTEEQLPHGYLMQYTSAGMNLIFCRKTRHQLFLQQYTSIDS